MGTNGCWLTEEEWWVQKVYTSTDDTISLLKLRNFQCPAQYQLPNLKQSLWNQSERRSRGILDSNQLIFTTFTVSLSCFRRRIIWKNFLLKVNNAFSGESKILLSPVKVKCAFSSESKIRFLQYNLVVLSQLNISCFHRWKSTRLHLCNYIVSAVTLLLLSPTFSTTNVTTIHDEKKQLKTGEPVRTWDEAGADWLWRKLARFCYTLRAAVACLNSGFSTESKLTGRWSYPYSLVYANAVF